MISCLLTSVKAETLKAILQGAGLEILTEGGPQEVAGFFASQQGKMPEHLAFIFLTDLERVHKDHDGEKVGQPSPVPAGQPVATLGTFFELLRTNRPDAGYFKDLEEIHGERS